MQRARKKYWNLYRKGNRIQFLINLNSPAFPALLCIRMPHLMKNELTPWGERTVTCRNPRIISYEKAHYFVPPNQDSTLFFLTAEQSNKSLDLSLSFEGS